MPTTDVPFLALAHDIVLFPALVVSIHLASPHARALIAHLELQATTTTTRPASPHAATAVIACVPRKARPTLQNRLADAANRILADEQQQQQLANVIQPGDDDRGDDSADVEIDSRDLFECKHSGTSTTTGRFRRTDRKRCADGTACRVVRFERTSSRHGDGGYLVVLEGLARISFDPATALTSIPHKEVDDAKSAAPVYTLRTVTVHPAAAATLSPQDAKLLAPLRDAATAVLDALTATVPAPLPAVFERRLRTLIGRLSLASAPALIDALFGTLPLSSPSNTSTSTNESTTANNATTAAIGLTHADKLLILSLVSAPLRLEKAISILSRAREGLSTRDRIDQTVARRQREFALLQQLLAIRTELDQLAKESGRSGGGNAQTKGSSSSSLPGTGSKAITSRRKGLVLSRKGRAGGGFAADDGAADEDDEEEDEMAELERKVEAKRFSDEARRVAHREMKRLKKTPPQGAEHGVIRAFSLFSLRL